MSIYSLIIKKYIYLFPVRFLFSFSIYNRFLFTTVCIKFLIRYLKYYFFQHLKIDTWTKRMTSGTPSVHSTDTHVDLKSLRISVCIIIYDRISAMFDLYASQRLPSVPPSLPNGNTYLEKSSRTHRLSPVNESPIKIAAPLAASVHMVVAKPRKVSKRPRRRGRKRTGCGCNGAFSWSQKNDRDCGYLNEL